MRAIDHDNALSDQIRAPTIAENSDMGPSASSLDLNASRRHRIEEVARAAAPNSSIERKLPSSPPLARLLGSDELDRWDAFIALTTGGSIFQTSGWIEAVREAFGHRPFYLVAEADGGIRAALPLVEVRSLIGGPMLVSVPYGVYGGVVGDDPHAILVLSEAATDLAARIGATTIDLRSTRAAMIGWPVESGYVTFRRALPDTPESCLERLPRKARAAARAARDKHRLHAEIHDGYLPIVWRKYCETMRRLGSINYPRRFCEALLTHTPGQHFVIHVTRGGKTVGGLISFVYKGTVMPYFVGVDAKYRHMNASNFVYLAAMEHAVTLGCHTFDFGRSRTDNVGACDFKRNQGFSPTPLQYQRFTTPGANPPSLSPSHRRFALARRIWPLLPGTVTRLAGGWLAKHIPG